MKKLSFKSLVCLLLVAVLTVSVVYMPGMSLTASAACANGCSFTAQKIGAKYLKSESTCGKQAVYYYSCAVCGASSAERSDSISKIARCTTGEYFCKECFRTKRQ